MNNLNIEKQTAIIAALTEGCSIRSVERLTGVHRDTIMRLGFRVGVGCSKLHNALMRDLRCNRVELDEAWSYVGKKRKNVTKDDPKSIGDQYVFVALDATSKGIIYYCVGKRDAHNTQMFCLDLRERVIGAPEISSDAFRAYPIAVENAFGANVHHGVIDKHYA